MNIERRMDTPGQVAVETRENGNMVITGYAAVFHRADDPGTQYRLSKDYVERIAPTAFDRALREQQDAMGLYNHDPSFLLGRRSSGTLRLSVDKVGLRYEIDHNPADPQHVSVMEKLKRGDLKGSSFAFRVTKQSFEKAEKHDIRNVHDVDLLDVGPVSAPAYASTTAGTRSGECQEAFEARDAWQKERESERAKRERDFQWRKKLLDMENQLS